MATKAMPSREMPAWSFLLDPRIECGVDPDPSLESMALCEPEHTVLAQILKPQGDQSWKK
jgi:hypothetical protein